MLAYKGKSSLANGASIRETASRIRVCHLAMADLAAGAEIQLAILLASLAKMRDLEVSAVLFNEGYLASKLRGLRVKTEVIPESRHNPLSIFRQLVDYFKRQEIDIIHTHKHKDNVLGVLASLHQGIRGRVRTVHGSPEPFAGFEAAKMSMYESIDNCANRWLVDRILAVSADLQAQLIKRFGAEKVTCIHNAIDVDQIRVTRPTTEMRRELNLGEQDFVIGTMGRLVPVKGLDCFLRAAQIIHRQRPNVKFIIAGDGPLKSSLQSMARQYGLDPNVLFLGHRNDSYNILRLMDLFVLPSSSEGIPMVLLEALALARPVVASRVGGIPEVVEHGVNGLLVPPGNDDELACTCVAVMENCQFARALGAAGRKRVETQFSATFMAEKVAEVYRALVSSGGGR
jgi:glycosyltransferase involved in cell wall biosynthesis